MPKRADINSVLVIGAGPIVIGQACEFDYSGTQACRALRQEGIRVVLLNSNPATIMTDAEMADATYVEPIDAVSAAAIIEQEQVDAVLPTMGGQTALNCAMALAEMSVFGRGRAVDGKPLLIGASAEAIMKAEDRQAFRETMHSIGLATAPSRIVGDLQSAIEGLEEVGFPVIVRPSFTLGGAGGGIAYNREEFNELIARGLSESPTASVLMERSLLGWKEFEMEVVRDQNDNCIIVCGIENFDPMGVHTGDSITVAPIQTLTDKEYQRMRDASIAILRAIGVDTGGSNVQFAVNPQNGEMVVIEMNPRVSRSSALASKATGFPIAKVATLLAIGYTLDEIQNDITQGQTPASFEPSIDYVVTKIPRFDFAKFVGSEDRLTTQMQSVGEVMAIGRTFAESLQKAARSLEKGYAGLPSHLPSMPMAVNTDQAESDAMRASQRETVLQNLSTPYSERLADIADALRLGATVDEVAAHTRIDHWFLYEIKKITDAETDISAQFSAAANADVKAKAKTKASATTETTAATFADALNKIPAADVRAWKRLGFSDRQIIARSNTAAEADEAASDALRHYRNTHNIHPAYKHIDTCAGEFPTETSYLYSTYETHCELQPSDRRKMMILGSGPNRIGQGIEFDYCCVHGLLALKDAGYETIMVNCNPETVSTDYDLADRLFFEPLTAEDVLAIVRREQPAGVIVQFGGQTPLAIAAELHRAGVPIIGTSIASIHRSESREEFQMLINQCGLRQPRNAIFHIPKRVDAAATKQAVIAAAASVGYPLVVRPSYVLGGQAMRVVYGEEDLSAYLDAFAPRLTRDVLLDKFLDNAIEVDVDAVRDHSGGVIVAGIMEHIERAGIHSGDSACCCPPFSLPAATIDALHQQAKTLAAAVEAVGLINIQFAIQNGDIYVLEVNPRASRTVPFVSKTLGIPVAKIAAQVMAGATLAELGVSQPAAPAHFAVKEAVFPFNKFPRVDINLGPEMKSTGESMGIGADFPLAFYLAQQAITDIPTRGKVFFSVRDADKAEALGYAKTLVGLGWTLAATTGTAKWFRDNGLAAESLNKVGRERPTIVDQIISREPVLVVNTREDSAGSDRDSSTIRHAALASKIMCFTTMAGTAAIVDSIRRAHAHGRPPVRPLQNWYAPRP